MKSGAAYKRRDGIYLHCFSETTVGVHISTAPFIKIELAASDTTKGEAVLAALNASAKGLPHPQQHEWDSLFEPMLKLANVKSWRAFETESVSCEFVLEDGEGELNIIPSRLRGPDQGFESLETATVKVSMATSPAEIGGALEEAFKRCP